MEMGESQEHKDIVNIVATAMRGAGYICEIEKKIGPNLYDLVVYKENDRNPRFIEVYVSYKPPRYVEPKKPNVKCHKCGRKWFTKSKMMYVSCPSCRSKTKNQESEM